MGLETTANPDVVRATRVTLSLPKGGSPLRRLASNAVHILASQALGFGMALMASVVMARTLGPNDLGIFHQSQWFVGLVSVFLSLGLCTSLTKFTAQFRAQNRPGAAAAALRFILRIELAIGFISTVALLLFSSRIADYYFSPNETGLFALAFLGLLPGLQTALYNSALEGSQIFRYQSLHAITLTPLALIAKIGLLLGGYGLTGLLAGNVAVAFLNLLFFGWAARREGLFRKTDTLSGPETEWKGEVFKYHRSLIGIHFVDLLVWSRTENFFLGRFCSAAQIAYYNLALNLLQRLSGTIPNLMWKILLPLTTELQGAQDHGRMERTFTHSLRYTAFVLFPLITFCYMAAYELVVIFYGHAYAPAKSSFQILCVSALLSALAQPSSAAIYATNRQRFILWYGSCLAVLNLALNFWLIPLHGAVGAAWSYTVTTSLGVLGGFGYLKISAGFSLPWASFGKAALASGVMAAILGWWLRWDHDLYAIFSPLQDQIHALTGRRLDMFLGSRTLRLMSGTAVSSLFYIAILILTANPQPEDRRILRALERRLPFSWKFPLPAFLRLRFSHRPASMETRAHRIR